MKIIFTDQSKEDLQNIENYLLEVWNYKVYENFLDQLDFALDIISSGNVIFSKYDNTNYHKFLLTKHNTLIYEALENNLFITRILQNFQDPEENLKSLT